ncbi:hypothetical protein MKW98_018692, partial [Papaver atlanticum]
NDSVSEFGELVADPKTNELLHHTKKPNIFVSDIIDYDVYIFTPYIFKAMSWMLRQVNEIEPIFDVYPAFSTVCNKFILY